MADETPHNGRPPSRYEWDAHLLWSKEELTEMKRCHEVDHLRLDELERKWIKYTGPIVVMLMALGVVATVASIGSAAIVIAGATP